MAMHSSLRSLAALLPVALFATNAIGQHGRWTNLGYGLPGQLGAPSLQATPAQFGRMLNVHADNVPGFSLSVCVFGSLRIDAPLFGGVLVPEPTLLVSGVASASTRQTYQLLLPDVCLPLPFDLHAQVVVYDPTAPQDWSFSNALGTTVRDNIPSDFNGDGYSDLAVGVPAEDVQGVVNAGAVNVVYGSQNGLTAAGNELLRPGKDVHGVIAAGPVFADHFASVLATGDFNGDGFDDLAAAAPSGSTLAPGGSTLDHGKVQVIYGSPVGLQGGAAGPEDQVFLQGNGLGEVPEEGDRFGHALACGDFDGDGYDDLAIGVPFEDVGDDDCGLVHVLFGGPAGLADSVQYARPTGTGVDEHFGLSLAMGDLDGDGIDELAVGVPWADVGAELFAGVVVVMRRDIDGNLSSYELHRDSVLNGLQVEGAADQDDHFGFGLAVADFSRDGAEDLVVGVPYESVNGQEQAGSFHLFRYQVGSSMPVDDSIWHQDVAGVDGATHPFELFGSRFAICDHSGDGLPDLVIGSPYEQVFSGVLSGSVLVLRGSATTGLTATGDVLYTYAGLGLGAFVPDMRFGDAVTAGRYAGGCSEQLVIGIPNAVVNSVEAGSVVVVDDGVAVEWSQAPLAGQLNSGDLFGAALGF